jgi:hypothetical protein
MHMRVDQPRQQRPVTKIDHLRARRMLDRRAHFHDLLALHQHFARLHDAPILHIEQTRRVQHNRMSGSTLSLRRTQQCEARKSQQ